MNVQDEDSAHHLKTFHYLQPFSGRVRQHCITKTIKMLFQNKTKKKIAKSPPKRWFIDTFEEHFVCLIEILNCKKFNLICLLDYLRFAHLYVNFTL